MVDTVQLEREMAAMAGRGTTILQRFMEKTGRRHQTVHLPDLYVDPAAALLECSASQLRKLDREGEIPAPRTVQTGSLARRVYNYNEINHIRMALGKSPSKIGQRSPICIAFSCLKGGSGKSVHSLHLIHYLAMKGYRVLAVDTDPQATLTTAFGIIPEIDLALEDVLVPVLIEAPQKIKNIVRNTHWDNIDLIPSSPHLNTAEWVIPREDEKLREQLGAPGSRLAQALNHIKHQYDAIVIDTAPSISIGSTNAQVAANMLIIPVSLQIYHIASMIQYLHIQSEIHRRTWNGGQANTEIVRFLPTNVDTNSGSTREMDALLHAICAQFKMLASMPRTRELERTGYQQTSLYELSGGLRDSTLQRARDAMDRVNAEILRDMQTWWMKHGDA